MRGAPIHPSFVVAIRRLVRRETSHAEIWRRLAPTAARLGVARPSYPTVLRVARRERRLMEARKHEREAFLAELAAGRVPRQLR
jgi:hypothetical protein